MRIERITKSELIIAIQEARAQLDELIDQLPPEQLLIPIGEGDWTVKDVLAHIMAWEQRMIIWVTNACAGTTPAVAPSQIDFEQVNTQTYAAYQVRPLPEVIAEYHLSFRNVLIAVESVPEHIIEDSSHIPWLAGRPLWKVIAANTWWHYNEHGKAIM